MATDQASFGAYTAGQDALSQLLLGQDTSSFNTISDQYGLGVNQLQQNTANQQAQLGLSQQDLATQQGALGRQGPLQSQLEALTQQGFGTTQAGLDLQKQIDRQGAANQRFSQLGSAAASGATNTVGNVRALGNIDQNLKNQLAQIGLSEQSLGQSRGREALTYKESQAQLTDRKKGLDTAAKRLGLSGTQLSQQLQNGLQQLGLDKQVSLGQLADAVITQGQGGYTALQPILNRIYQAQGLPAPQMMPGG